MILARMIEYLRPLLLRGMHMWMETRPYDGPLIHVSAQAPPAIVTPSPLMVRASAER